MGTLNREIEIIFLKKELNGNSRPTETIQYEKQILKYWEKMNWASETCGTAVSKRRKGSLEGCIKKYLKKQWPKTSQILQKF